MVDNHLRSEEHLSNPQFAHTPCESIQLSSQSLAQSIKRLILSNLILENFKSYGGIHEIGPFHDRFTSIVGPNGSGKSNVIDALLFVFGYRASKIRQGKLSELIHHSTEFANCEACRVSVVFEEKLLDVGKVDQFSGVEKSFDLKSGPWIITRTANQNNKSQYYINEKASTFTEVTAFLRSKGFDLDHNRFLILQGEVETIAQMKPKATNPHEDGLLEYLEDIIGTSILKPQLEATERELEDWNEKSIEMEQRLRLIERELSLLRTQRDEALGYIDLENRKAIFQAKIFDYHLHHARSERLKLEQEQEETHKNIVSRELSIQEIRSAVATLQTELSTQSKLLETLASQLKQAKADFAVHEREYISLQEKARHTQKEMEKLDKTLNSHQDQLREMSGRDGEIHRRMKAAKLEITQTQLSIEEEETNLETLRSQLEKDQHVQKYQSKVNLLQTKLSPYLDSLRGAQSHLTILENEHKMLQEELSSQTDAREMRIRKREEWIRIRTERLQRLEAARRHLSDLQTRRSSLMDTISSLESEESRVFNSLSDIRLQVELAQSQLTNLTSQPNGGRTVQLLQALSRANIPDIYGRLGDLGTISHEYDIAITTACSGLDNIVVQSTSSAQSCVEYLRSHRLGRATFIILDQMPEPTTSRFSASRLFDLMQTQDRFRPAFYHALRDTLVVESLSIARKLAYSAQRCRVVTLDGVLIDKNGTMSGGGSKALRGGMLLTGQSIRTLTDDSTTISGLESTISALETQRQSLIQTVELLKEKKAAHVASLDSLARNESPDVELTLQQCELDFNESQTLCEQLTDDVEVDGLLIPRLKKLSAEISRQRNALTPIEANISELQNQLSILQEEIQTTRDTQAYTESQKKLSDLRLKLSSFQAELSTLSHELTRLPVILQSLQNVHQTLLSKKTTFSQEFTDLQSQLETKTELAAQVHAQSQTHEELCTLKTQGISALQCKLSQEKTVLDRERSELTRITEKLQEMEYKSVEFKKREEHFIEKHRNLKIMVVKDDATLASATEEQKGSMPELERQHLASAQKLSPVDTVPLLEHHDLHGMKLDNEINNDQEILLEDQDTLHVSHGHHDHLHTYSLAQLESQLASLEKRLSQLPTPNLSVLIEYTQKNIIHSSHQAVFTSLLDSRNDCTTRLQALAHARFVQFTSSLKIITAHLKSTYAFITMGGQAELEFLDSMDPFTEGIILSVMPPRKSWKRIEHLSGGEKTLSSLSLVLALHHFRPSPLYVMDEIDAALDYRNVSWVGESILQWTNSAQFIVISLRNQMFERAERLMGIYKVENCTRAVVMDKVRFESGESTQEGFTTT